MPSVAIVGASNDRAKFGNKAVRAYQRKNYVIYPVNPSAAEIEGIRAFCSLRDVPANQLDLVTYYLPPHLTLKALEDVEGKTVGEVLFNPGSYDDEVLKRAQQLHLPYAVGCSIVAAGFEPSQFS